MELIVRCHFSVICAVSTLAANPLQALQDMLARPPDFPPWVDNTHLRYSLIVHPNNSPLSDSMYVCCMGHVRMTLCSYHFACLYRAESLVNAVKKQYGLHTYLLSISLAEIPLQQARPIASPVPRLPSLTTMELSPIPSSQIPAGVASLLAEPATPRQSTFTSSGTSTPSLTVQPNTPRGRPQSPGIARTDALALSDNDIQQISRFVREFVVMSVVPWMEKCVMEWNESVGPKALSVKPGFDYVRSTHLQDGSHHVYFPRRAVFSVQDTLLRLPLVLPHPLPAMGAILQYLQ